MTNSSDFDSEKAVLGCILLNNEVIENAIEILTPNDFFDSKHQRIYSTMQKMYENNEPLEPLLLSKRTMDCFPDVSVSEEELQQLADSSPAPSSIEFYAQRIVREFSRRESKRLLDVAKKEIESSEDTMYNISELVSRL